MSTLERTILDIEARILHRSHMRYEEFSLTYDATDGKAKLREIVNDVQSRLNGYRQWSWAVKQATLTGTGSRTIALPADFNSEIRIIDEVSNREVQVVPHSEFLDRYVGLTSVGFPFVAAFPDQSHVEMYPAMSTGNTVTLWYVRDMPEMMNDSDVPDVPMPILGAYNRALIEGALIDVFEYGDNPQMATRQETSKYPIALKELVRVAGAGNSSYQVRESRPAGYNPNATRPFLGSMYPNYRW